MKLSYPIPHRVTARMVGAMFVASCTCRKWAAQADPRAHDRLLVMFPGMASAVEDLLEKAHQHASDHVLEQFGLKRKAA
jgi:hypothetical protein